MRPPPDLRTTARTAFRTAGFFARTTPALSTFFSRPVLWGYAAPGAILLKKKRASYAIARLSSFEETDKPRASSVTQAGGAA